MSLLTFKGGVHPNDGKALAKDKAIVQVQPKGDLVYPMSQHIGAPAVPIVAKGDHVLRGQMIAEAGGFVSAPIYASVSGTVKVIEPRFTPAGSKVNSIVIENDGEYEEVEYSTPKAVSEMSKEEILNAIGDAGIVGMGGAGFPTKVKLSPKEPDKIDYIIANCAECEPYITADYRQILEHGEELVEGMKIILRLFDNAKGLFGVEDNKPDCIEKLKELTKDEPRMEVLKLQTKYPQGGERQLIYATTGRAINSSMLPADAGCVVDNVATISAIYRAVAKGEPSMDRIVTVSGDAVHEPGNFKVPFGMNQAELIEAAGGYKVDPEKIISGGPMMGFSMFTLEAPVTKTSSSVLGFTKDATYSITTDNPYATYVVYTAFEKVNTNRSSGETLTLSTDVTFNYYGNDVTLHIGDTYVEDNLKNIIRVYMEGSDVTSEVTITIKMTDETGEVVDTIDTTKLGTYKVEYLVQYKNASKTFTKNITVLE